LIVLGCGCAGVIAGLCWCMVEEWFWGVGESIFILVVWGEWGKKFGCLRNICVTS
jgi:hypothetical protein